MRTLSTEQLRTMIENDEEFALINVLSEEEFQKQHIPESVNVPLGELNFVEEVERIAGSMDEKVVVYCANVACNASQKAVDLLEKAGFSNVYRYEGGNQAWRESGLLLRAGA